MGLRAESSSAPLLLEGELVIESSLRLLCGIHIVDALSIIVRNKFVNKHFMEKNLPL